MKKLLVLIFICLTFDISAKDFSKKGKLITLDGDTLACDIVYQGRKKSLDLVEISTDSGIKSYSPFEIRGYKFDDGQFFVSKVLITKKDTMNIFAEYLVQGEKDLFTYRRVDADCYALSLSANEIREIPFKIKEVEIEEVDYQGSMTSHIGYLKYYFRDCPSVFPDIERINAPNRNALVRLTRKYNETVCGYGSCVLFVRKKDPVRLSIEPAYLVEVLGEEKAKFYGVYLSVWLPNSDERLSVKTGLLYNRFKNREKYGDFIKVRDFDYYQFPVLMEYVVNKNFISPKFDLGFCGHFFYQDFQDNYTLQGGAVTCLGGAGFIMRFSDTFLLDVEVMKDLFEIKNSPYCPKTLYAKVGLQIRLNLAKQK